MSIPMKQSSYRRSAPAPVSTGNHIAEETAYQAQYIYSEDLEDDEKDSESDVPPPPPPPLPDEEDVDGDAALLDLTQLEELQSEAERMKALGNKHMAAQEYTRAFNAYSAALQLSPVGPSSHVFLSNRAAALLSLKRYAAAATDARRAVVLAPTFGKAHARLGQSLYFLKDYAGAVDAYEDAVQYEPDNEVTKTYLEKARRKLARQQEKAARAARGDDVSMAEESMVNTVAYSIATDPHGSAAVVTSGGIRSSASTAIGRAIGAPKQVEARFSSPAVSPITPRSPEEPEDDPDFEEALRIQQRALHYLSAKQYRHAIEEFSAALFLVPDDPYLSPELHLGRAHALNGSRRHESARIDAKLAVKQYPTPEAYSTLAKSEFYLHDYPAAIEAFEDCMELLPEGETLGIFDQAYLKKAQDALREETEHPSHDDSYSVTSSRSAKSLVPKLPPPRFVPREKAIASTPNMPSMPKSWPQQPLSPSAVQVGEERSVTFLTDSLGIKLNRGPDGLVRVFSVAPDTAASPILRKGEIHVGDVVREAAGVDIRRPITNIMWGDTVALIKMAPRPITLVVAQEISELPKAVEEERQKTVTTFSLSPNGGTEAHLGEIDLSGSLEGDIFVEPDEDSV